MTEPKQVPMPILNFGEDPRRAQYTDIFRLAFNPTTFTLEFYQATLPNPGEEPKCNFVGAICMSPHEAKLFSNAVKNSIENYEKENGEIKIRKEQTWQP